MLLHCETGLEYLRQSEAVGSGETSGTQQTWITRAPWYNRVKYWNRHPLAQMCLPGNLLRHGHDNSKHAAGPLQIHSSTRANSPSTKTRTLRTDTNPGRLFTGWCEAHLAKTGTHLGKRLRSPPLTKSTIKPAGIRVETLGAIPSRSRSPGRRTHM